MRSGLGRAVLGGASGAAAALGSVTAPRLAELLPERRLVNGLLVASSAAVVALAMALGVWSYGVLRFVPASPRPTAARPSA